MFKSQEQLRILIIKPIFDVHSYNKSRRESDEPFFLAVVSGHKLLAL